MTDSLPVGKSLRYVLRGRDTVESVPPSCGFRLGLLAAKGRLFDVRRNGRAQCHRYINLHHAPIASPLKKDSLIILILITPRIHLAKFRANFLELVFAFETAGGVEERAAVVVFGDPLGRERAVLDLG